MKHHYIIADHVRASVFLISDGVKPSGKEQGYVLRRLMRRALASSLELGIDIGTYNFFKELIESVVATYKSAYPELQEIEDVAVHLFERESQKYQKAITTGQKEWNKYLTKEDKTNSDLAQKTFDLYQSHGVPLELSTKILEKKGVLNTGFESKLQRLIREHQQKSQDKSTKKFKGGLEEASVYTTKLHTATHILHHQLRALLGTSIKQMGSRITSDKARFDFSFDRRLTDLEIDTLTKNIQSVIDKELQITKQEMSTPQARELGAIGLFGEKYGERVTVYTIQDAAGTIYSREFCGGPHVANTKEIGTLEITKQKSVGQGVKRIEFIGIKYTL